MYASYLQQQVTAAQQKAAQDQAARQAQAQQQAQQVAAQRIKAQRDAVKAAEKKDEERNLLEAGSRMVRSSLPASSRNRLSTCCGAPRCWGSSLSSCSTGCPLSS